MLFWSWTNWRQEIQDTKQTLGQEASGQEVLGQAVVVEKTFVGQYEKLMAEMKADDPAVLSGANTVQTRCLRLHHGVNTV